MGLTESSLRRNDAAAFVWSLRCEPILGRGSYTPRFGYDTGRKLPPREAARVLPAFRVHGVGASLVIRPRIAMMAIDRGACAVASLRTSAAVSLDQAIELPEPDFLPS